MNRKTLISGLRWMADFYEQHPEVNPPYSISVNDFENDTKEQMATVARALGTCDKTYSDDWFSLVKELGDGFRWQFNARRNEVCERVKVAEKVIPAHTLPAREAIEVPEKIEEVFEWQCPESLLAVSK